MYSFNNFYIIYWRTILPHDHGSVELKMYLHPNQYSI